MKTEVVKGYRFVTNDLRSKHGAVRWRVGEWQHVGGELSLCNLGFHACKEPTDSLEYVFGERWFSVEAKGTFLFGDDKFCCSDMRLVKEIPVTVIKRWAVECAKHVLPIYEKHYPNDNRPREAIDAAERYLADPSEENLKNLRDAAWDAARDAAWVAARDADRVAAWVAAWDAAWVAARAAAHVAAWTAEIKWQKRLLNRLIKQALKEARR